MTNPGHDGVSGRWMGWRVGAACAALSAACVVLALGGCSKEEPPPPPPPPPPVVRAPEPVRVEGLSSDRRVQFPQAFAPTDEDLARAVADFASAIARGDADAASLYMDGPAKATLASLVQSGEWKSATGALRAVRVVRLVEGGDGVMLGLAMEDSVGAYLTGWRGTRAAGQWVFTGMPVPPRSAANAAELDNAELAVAAEPEPAAGRRPAPAAAPEEPAEPAPTGPAMSPGSMPN